MRTIGRFFLKNPGWLATLVLVALLALPVSVWLDLRNLSDQNLNSQASTLNRVISVFRAYYASNVVARISAAGGQAYPLHDFRDTEGGIPIPATLSIELGNAIGAEQGDVDYRFVSDYSFTNRAPHVLTPLEVSSLANFRRSGDASKTLTSVMGNLVDRSISVVTPVVMESGCVACHNAHPESPKTDWRVGDIRGIQSVTVRQPLALSLWSFKWLLAYLLVAGGFGAAFATVQFRLAGQFDRLNSDLEDKNRFLANVSEKLSKYLSPQVFKSIFLGEKGVEISTERKKLTVFFSDIKDFTATTERLQPEELTELLNEYFSEMSVIAEKHGATIDKFIGDAIVGFFGDPVSQGVAQDARACVTMALEMQRRLADLNTEWLSRGYEHPLRARIGINTGYCNVGNFGSATRMDYTVIGAEANLAARLESIAEPGGIVISYETWAHVRDIVGVRQLEPTKVKGISREVVPYAVVMPNDEHAAGSAVKESSAGLQLFLDPALLDAQSRTTARAALTLALERIGGESEPKKRPRQIQL
ncbi:adenylate/guanylate cyclase [Hoeflea halophila]|uniref:Adenylate/guanylate cyclase n=1 Tax=Hoeflea halophila TaxID=714899 RepID=A0A286IGV4_9HYPH|nr:adenylate/guanylate cyclase domain-containing protein [Hoeflea halophila]SOE18574.1 adenylate/guanylate cyclase [Hoeflea halophila]